MLNEDDKLKVALLQKFIATTGSLLEEEEKPTIEQLLALEKKLGKPGEGKCSLLNAEGG